MAARNNRCPDCQQNSAPWGVTSCPTCGRSLSARPASKTNTWLTVGSIGVVSIIVVLLLGSLILMIKANNKPPQASERVYHVQSSQGWQIGFVSADACSEADAAVKRNDDTAFSKIISSKGVRIHTDTPLQMMGDLKGDVVGMKVLSGEHQGETVYLQARDVH